LDEIGRGEIASRVGVVDSEDAGIEGRSYVCCAIALFGEGGAVGSVAQGGEGVPADGLVKDFVAVGGGGTVGGAALSGYIA
jgi:hypothetical protein